MIDSGLNLFSANKLENLVEALAKVLERPLSDVFEKETIIVQSQGMSRWLSLNLAGYHGICANTEYMFPNAFVHKVLGSVFPSKNDLSSYEPDIMAWKISRLLSDMIDRKEFVTIKNYFGKNTSELKKYQLSALISDTFDQYLLFRPNMIKEWEAGKENHWQAVLWRKTVEESRDIHRAELLFRLKNEIETGTFKKEHIPARISVVGISSLPSFHMEIFDLLSKYVQVNLFLLNPCREYWGDIVSDVEIKKIKNNVSINQKDEIYLEKGNSLLASMGALGRDFFDLINNFDHEAISLFESPGCNTLLTSIQTDIFSLNERGESDTGNISLINDRSVEIHSCHSPMREIEILRDSLYDMFENDKELLPRDIIVMTPDIEVFSPLIKAVFDKAPTSAEHIPYSIADRNLKNESRIVESLIAVLDLASSRFTVSEVMNILDTAAVREKFMIDDKDVEIILLWIKDTNIRWGVDARHRAGFDLPEFDENSWVSGLKRMLLGYAMPGDGETLFSGILPYNNIEGDTSVLLGKLYEFIDKLILISEELKVSRSAEMWQVLLNQLLDSFFILNDETQKELQTIRDEINKLVVNTDIAKYDDKIDLSVIRFYLSKKLEGKEIGFGFISGGITFCAMLPMRSIPFKVICIIGMNSDIYPRQTRTPGFDLIAKKPVRGDRSRRKDDRYLFLEILISVREKLYISYTGQSIKDNSKLQPSVLVSELLDYINDEFTEKNEVSETFKIIEHPLQAFNYKYFDNMNSELFSYSEANFRAAEKYLSDDYERKEFINQRLPLPEKKHFEINVNDLCRFFKNPSKYFLEKRLGIFLQGNSSVIEDDEPFEIDWLDKYLISNDIAAKLINGKKEDGFYKVLKVAGVLPFGESGKNEFRIVKNEVAVFSSEVNKLIQGVEPIQQDINITIGGVKIFGRIENIYNGELIEYRYAKIKGKDLLDFWIKYLVLSLCSVKTGDKYSGVIAGKDFGTGVDGAFRADSVDEPQTYLEDMIQIYIEGMTAPLEFFSESSMKYTEELAKGSLSDEDALIKALKVWHGSSYTGNGECNDLYYELCFKHFEPLNENFKKNSLIVFEPLLANIEKVNPE